MDMNIRDIDRACSRYSNILRISTEKEIFKYISILTPQSLTESLRIG